LNEEADGIGRLFGFDDGIYAGVPDKSDNPFSAKSCGFTGDDLFYLCRGAGDQAKTGA